MSGFWCVVIGPAIPLLTGLFAVSSDAVTELEADASGGSWTWPSAVEMDWPVSPDGVAEAIEWTYSAGLGGAHAGNGSYKDAARS